MTRIKSIPFAIGAVILSAGSVFAFTAHAGGVRAGPREGEAASGHTVPVQGRLGQRGPDRKHDADAPETETPDTTPPTPRRLTPTPRTATPATRPRPARTVLRSRQSHRRRTRRRTRITEPTSPPSPATTTVRRPPRRRRRPTSRRARTPRSRHTPASRAEAPGRKRRYARRVPRPGPLELGHRLHRSRVQPPGTGLDVLAHLLGSARAGDDAARPPGDSTASRGRVRPSIDRGSAANASQRARRSKFAGVRTTAAFGLPVIRAPSGVWSGRYLPVRKPDSSGKNGMTPETVSSSDGQQVRLDVAVPAD